jgi:hypothetical protein
MSKVMMSEGIIEILSTKYRSRRRYNRSLAYSSGVHTMSSTLERTQAMLARHHRDGQRFAQMMHDPYPAATKKSA